MSIPAGKPQIIEKTENSVTLTWTRSTKIGASSLVGYTVEMYGRNATENWIPIANRVQNTTYTHTGLIAGVSYFFVIRAENAHGMSAPSPLSEPVVLGLVSDFILLLLFPLLRRIQAAKVTTRKSQALNYSFFSQLFNFNNFVYHNFQY